MANDGADFSFAMELVYAPVLPMVLHAATELDLFEIIASAGAGAKLSPSQIASHLPTANPDAPATLDRLLRHLAGYSVLTCSVVTLEGGRVERRYGLGPVCKYLVKDEDGGSLSPWLKLEKGIMDAWYYMKDAVLEGEVPFRKLYGMSVFDFMANSSNNDELFKPPRFNHTILIMKKVLENYNGFENQKQIVDVGGSFGTVVGMITAKYPHIKGINFDLPKVVEIAHPLPGVKHVGGNMFEWVPEGDTIVMKSVLHDWKDHECVAILKNCYKALPHDGKVVILDLIVPEVPDPANSVAKEVYSMDIMMLVYGGKERTKQDFDALAKEAGFVGAKFICRAFNFWIIELNKK
ncbi:hypothetical protein Sjap_024524 [Stephania japonica]|uniref:Uncharacterized protein n=1 Tax=Stephania japonica TaxID=461633 RepID=A0AAP0HNT2_9MAGN|nr:COMT protein [Stephania japonica]